MTIKLFGDGIETGLGAHYKKFLVDFTFRSEKDIT
jgi:hypothetical protein